jgi:CubicO group peptidase (beta-lactamase class C family)
MLWRALLLPTPLDPYAGCTSEFLYTGLASTRLHATPGQRFRYSSLGSGLLALAAQAGTSYEKVIAEAATGPLGMTRSDFTDDDLAQGHTRRLRPTPALAPQRAGRSGSAVVHVSDLLAMVRSQLGGGLSDLAAAIRRTREVRHPINRWTLTHLGSHGVRLHPRFGSAEQTWHNGGTGGFRSWVGFIPERQAAVAVLSNTTRWMATRSTCCECWPSAVNCAAVP